MKCVDGVDSSESSSNSSSEYGSSNETYWGSKRGPAYRSSLPEKKTFPTLAKVCSQNEHTTNS